jgi:hypothetical protein
MERTHIIKNWFRIALLNLVLATLLGALLRYAFVEEVAWIKFRNVLHGHSHAAMLGWLYLALFALLAAYFLPERADFKWYNRLFWLTELSVLGMLVAFPIQGYGAASIAFSTLHILLSYVWAWRFWTDTRGETSVWSLRFARAAIVFMIVSTLAIWSIGPILMGGFRSSTFFHLAVQFFLHFQFNGWFIFAALALALRWMEQRGIVLPAKRLRLFFILLVVSCMLTYALAVAWSNPLPIVFGINGTGVTLQLAALLVFPRSRMVAPECHSGAFIGLEPELDAHCILVFCGQNSDSNGGSDSLHCQSRLYHSQLRHWLHSPYFTGRNEQPHPQPGAASRFADAKQPPYAHRPDVFCDWPAGKRSAAFSARYAAVGLGRIPAPLLRGHFCRQCADTCGRCHRGIGRDAGHCEKQPPDVTYLPRKPVLCTS